MDDLLMEARVTDIFSPFDVNVPLPELTSNEKSDLIDIMQDKNITEYPNTKYKYISSGTHGYNFLAEINKKFSLRIKVIRKSDYENKYIEEYYLWEDKLQKSIDRYDRADTRMVDFSVCDYMDCLITKSVETKRYLFVMYPYNPDYYPLSEIFEKKLDKIEDHFPNIINGSIDAIREIHQRKVAHRNIHPNNILYNPIKRRVKFVDFFLSCFNDGKKDNCDLKIQHKIRGDLNFMPPEILAGLDIDINLMSYQYGDLWSLGRCFQFLFTKTKGSIYREVLNEISRREQIYTEVEVPYIIEDIEKKWSNNKPKLPQAYQDFYIFYDKVLAFNNKQKENLFVTVGNNAYNSLLNIEEIHKLLGNLMNLTKTYRQDAFRIQERLFLTPKLLPEKKPEVLDDDKKTQQRKERQERIKEIKRLNEIERKKYQNNK